MRLRMLKVLTAQSFSCQHFFSFELIFAHWLELLYYVSDFDDTGFAYNDKFCFNFVRGKSKYGNRCKFSHESKLTFKVPRRESCSYLETSKGCFKGQQCKFSHEIVAGNNGATTQPPQSTARSRPQSELETGFREWSFLIPRRNTPFRVVEIGKFFKVGWEPSAKSIQKPGNRLSRS